MSFPPLFQVLTDDATVRSVLGTRIYPHGEAPQKVVEPYAVYQQIFGASERYLATTPDADSSTNQIDVYSKQMSDARAAALAIRDALEGVAYVDISEGPRDPATNRARVILQVDWITLR